ncbi:MULTISPECIES: hypothetical protein [unclassified Bradyrhizobium]|uniref:hypothetical protein n=1 Tax=unclassified Bradyrhizobium TaxID=2631580 RepID=UPI00247A2B39|nr:MULTISPECIES: hypothetical protein [unclassified Bradyrhizobium]WGS18941.1 hypothetical protein MTX22_31180 [Bradyrhizobium sp. ISRA463]WGS25774.1 hypothetical protein MTX19_28750 [Bradyrhizobium sp. ISRA464]
MIKQDNNAGLNHAEIAARFAAELSPDHKHEAGLEFIAHGLTLIFGPALGYGAMRQYAPFLVHATGLAFKQALEVVDPKS